MKVPWFGLIHDGAPNAFTYGHHPNNMRIVITQGILDLLEPEEVEGVVAHEIGHGKNWDMLLMTVVQLVPLLLYFLYRTALQSGGRGKDNAYRIPIAVGAYLLYIASEYIVLWFSRCREYYADRFAGRVTGNPNALASALVKIGYGLAARGQSPPPDAESEGTGKKKGKKKKEATFTLDAIGAMGIFDRKSALAMVASSASSGFDSSGFDRGSGDDRSGRQQGKPQECDAMGPVEPVGHVLRAELDTSVDCASARVSERSGSGHGRRAVHRLRSPQARVILGRFRG